MTRDEKLTERTCKLIREGKYLILKDKRNEWYLHQWTNIAAGWDKASWGKRNVALEMFDLKWAFTIAPLYKCRVYSYDPKTGIETLEVRNPK
jgi:hypothetical protein